MAWLVLFADWWGKILWREWEVMRISDAFAYKLFLKEMLFVYWQIGQTILAQQQKAGWGAKIIDRLSVDLKTEFPDFKGLSVRNLKYMRTFAEAYPQFGIVQEPLAPLAKNTGTGNNPIVQGTLAQLTWYHHITLLDKVKDPELRNFYILKTTTCLTIVTPC